MAKLFKIDGSIVTLENRAYAFEEIEKMIDGTLGLYTISRKPFIQVLCDDDGLAKELPLNIAIKDWLLKSGFIYPHLLVGDMILFESTEDSLIFDGQVHPVTKEHIPEE